MSLKPLLLTALLSLSFVLVGCNKKEETTSQSKPIQPEHEQIEKVDPSADLKAAREAYVDKDQPSKVEGHDFNAQQNATDQNTSNENEQNDMSSLLNAAAEDAQKQADQNK